jgi:hypothetical protein
MKLTAEPRYWFYPADDEALPKSARVAAEIIRPTASRRQELVEVVGEREFYRAEAGKEQDTKKTVVKTSVNTGFILRECVGKIRNLSAVETEWDEETGAEKKTERKIESGEELAECRAYGIDELVARIVNEVRSDELTEAKKRVSNSVRNLASGLCLA